MTVSVLLHVSIQCKSKSISSDSAFASAFIRASIAVLSTSGMLGLMICWYICCLWGRRVTGGGQGSRATHISSLSGNLLMSSEACFTIAGLGVSSAGARDLLPRPTSKSWGCNLTCQHPLLSCVLRISSALSCIVSDSLSSSLLSISEVSAWCEADSSAATFEYFWIAFLFDPSLSFGAAPSQGIECENRTREDLTELLHKQRHVIEGLLPPISHDLCNYRFCCGLGFSELLQLPIP